MILLVAWLLLSEPPENLHIPPLADSVLERSLPVRVGSDKWTFDCYRCDSADVENYVADNFAIIRKNGRQVSRWAPWMRPYVHAYRVDIDPGYPVIAVRGKYGLGMHWDTMLYSIRRGKLVKIGQPPAMNSNGPILWRGHRDIWAFDNYDRYRLAEMEPGYHLARVLYKVGSDGKLRKWRTIQTNHPRVPMTIHDEDANRNIPPGGL